MTDGVVLPLIVTGGVDPQVNASLAEAAQRLTAAEGAARTMSNAWTETKAKLDLAAAAFNRIVGFADQIAALTAEQQQLTAASDRLNLDFNAAADGAGRFVDETEAMAAASRLAEAGLHLTQEELNQLTARAAIASQRLGVDTTTAFNMLTTAIESGSTRALRPFGEDMVALGGSTHSAEERLSAFTTTTQGMARATDDASTSMARLRDSVGDAEREMASSFSAEIERLHTISTQTDAAASHAEDSVHQLRALGQTAALVVTGVLNGIGAVVGGVALGIAGAVGMARIAIADLNALRRGENVSAAHAAAIAEHFGRDSSAQSIQDFLTARVDALNALSSDQTNPRTETGAATRGTIGATASNDMVFGESQADADEAYRVAHRRQGTRGGTRRARPTLDQLMQRAGAAERYQVSGEIRLDESASELERNAASKAEAQRSADEGAYASERQQEIDRRARDVARRAHEQERDIGVGMREALTRYGDTALHTRDIVVGAFTDMTEATAKHIEAVVTGRESLGEALRGMLSDTLAAIAKRASVSAAEELVASIASLAAYDFPGAGLHAAAAVGYTGVAALAGAGSSAVAPAPTTPHAAPAGGTRAMTGSSSPTSKSGGEGQVVNVYFGGPVIGPGGSRQAARDIAAILNDGARQGGVRLTPNLLPVMP